jgi:hypothetical protein
VQDAVGRGFDTDGRASLGRRYVTGGRIVWWDAPVPCPITIVTGQKQGAAGCSATVEPGPLEMGEPTLGDVQAAEAQAGQGIGRAANGGRHDAGGYVSGAIGAGIGDHGNLPAAPGEGSRGGAAGEAAADDQGGTGRSAHAGASLCP